MKPTLQHIEIQHFPTSFGTTENISLSYEIFGRALHTAPIILVNHALTGNSTVSGERGWWNTLVGDGKVIDTQKFTVLCFNVPGNGYDGFTIGNQQSWKAIDVAKIFLLGLKHLEIQQLHTLIGGSVGGGIAWEMLALQNNMAQKFIPVASDFKTTDWLHSQCLVQQFLLNQNQEPLQKARIHAMLCYRTPQSLNGRFGREIDAEKNILKSQDWLYYHGKSLNERFSLESYKLMNQLLMNINTDEEKLKNITAEIHLVAVDSDLFFPASEVVACFNSLKKTKENVYYHEIKSVHGHDAFLMEYEQLNRILEPIFL